MSDRDITEDDIRDEHLDEVDARAHWLFLFAVLGGGTLLMIGLIAVLATLGAS